MVMYVDALFRMQTRIHQTMNKKFFEKTISLLKQPVSNDSDGCIEKQPKAAI